MGDNGYFAVPLNPLNIPFYAFLQCKSFFEIGLGWMFHWFLIFVKFFKNVKHIAIESASFLE
jgi:hypothetical protein